MVYSNMNKHFSFIGIIIVLNLLLSSTFADTIRVGGTGTAVGIMKLLADDYIRSNPGQRIKVLPSLGSSGGIRALKSEAIEIAMSSRKLKPDEVNGVSVLNLGTSPFVFISHPTVKENDISLQKVIDIYTGKQLTWSNGAHVRPILRPLSDTDSKIVAKISPEMNAALKSAHAKTGMSVAVTDNDTVDMVEKVQGGLSTSTLVLVLSENRAVKVLSLNGIVPTIKSMTEKKYTLSKTLFLLYSNVASKSTLDFVDYIRSKRSKKIRETAGLFVVQ